MFFNKIKKMLITFLLILNIIPINVFAYSDYVIASGKSVGITIKTKGIIVVGLYEVNGISPGHDAGINLGDKIIKIEVGYQYDTNKHPVKSLYPTGYSKYEKKNPYNK